jgi:hypothetical protein
VFAAGKYSVRVSDPESGKFTEVKNLEVGNAAAQKPVSVRV